MWYPKTLVIRNLMTHKETIFPFEVGKAVMISGINLDDTGTMSNGSGKSTLGEGVYLAITGESLRKERPASMVRRGEKYLETELILQNDQTKNELFIYRRISASGNGNQMKVLLNGEIPKQIPESSGGKGLVDIKEGTKFIFTSLGISQDDLENYFVLSKETYKPFLLSTDTVMKKVIDRFSNAQIVDPVFVLLTADIKEIDQKIQSLDRDLLKQETKIEGYNEEIERIKETDEESIKNQLIEGYQKEIEELQLQSTKITSDIEKLKEKKVTHESILVDQTKELETLNESKKQTSEKLTVFEEDQKKIKEKIRTKQGQIEQFTQIKAGFFKAIQDAVECPKCSHEFSLKDKEVDIEETKGLLKEVTGDIVKLERQEQKLKTDLETSKSNSSKFEVELTKWNREIMTKKGQIDTTKLAVGSVERESSSLLKSVDSTLKRVELLKLKVTEEKEREVIDRTEEIQKNIHECEKLILQINKDIQQKKTEKEGKVEQEIKFKKFKTYLANQSISSIEGYTNYYLKRINCNLQIKINGLKELADGQIREQISTIVLRDGVEEGGLKAYSGGEKAKIILCNIFALQAIINFNSDSGGLNLTWLDEIIESVDYVGIVDIYEALNQLNKCISIISHVKDTGFENELFVKKEGGTSMFVEKLEFLKLQLQDAQ